MTMRAALTLVVLSVATLVAAQPAPTLAQLVDRMGVYLTAYETQLSSVVADERFEQRIDYGRGSEAGEADTWFGEPGAVGGPGRSTRVDRRSRRLESEIAFIRLPGGAEWLGFRDVRKVDGRAVVSSGSSIGTVLASPAGDLTKARAIAEAGAEHNLGSPRTVNVPTAALEIVLPMHRAAHEFVRIEDERVRGTRTAVVRFLEVARPTLVKEPTGRNLVSSGRVWIEAATGTLWRIEWVYQAERRDGSAPPPRLRVDFAPHRELGMMVPIEMTEVFAISGGRGEGRATYSNFRRFGTSARIVPQHP
jgi:hypothetical protein